MRTRLRGLGVVAAAALAAVLVIALGPFSSSSHSAASVRLAMATPGTEGSDWVTTTTTTAPPAPPVTAAPAPTPAPVKQHTQAPRASRSAPGGGPCDRPSNCPQLRQCENGGSYGAGTNPSFYGAYQFADPSTRGMNQAQQDAHADQMYAQRGAQPWPVCGKYLR